MADPDYATQPGEPSPSAPLVATWRRWLASSATLAAALVAAVQGYLFIAHSRHETHESVSFSAFVPALAIGIAVGSLLVLALLRAEELRLARELRTARTGTPVLRALVARRAQQLPFLARWSSAKLGAAAVLLADGDRDGARDALAAGSVFARGGRVERLRAIVEADLERTTHTSVGLERCVQRLRAADRVGNREADLYRLLVLVKAVLEQGDGETGAELASELGQSRDEDERVYATWLRVWFGFDGEDGADAGASAGAGAGADAGAGAGAPVDEGDAVSRALAALPALTEGELRVATLAARAHGAEQLVAMLTKLTERLAAIAPIERRG